MRDPTADELRERVRDRYADAATRPRPATFTTPAAPGMHSAIVRAVKPGR